MSVSRTERALPFPRRLARLFHRMRHQPQGGEDGFALVELLVALVILALALGTAFEAISMGLRNTAKAEQLAKASSLAQSLLARAGTEIPLQPGVTSGQFDNNFRWQLQTTPYGDDADRKAWPVNAYTVQAEVTWNEGMREQSVTLTTLRLGPKGQP